MQHHTLPYDEIAEIPDELGYRLATLSLDPSSWINRRVEQVTYLDRGTTLRSNTSPSPWLTTVQNGILSSAMLSAVARLKRPDLIDLITERYIAELVFATDASTRQLAWKRIFPKSLETGRHLYSRPEFRALAEDLSENFILFVDTSRARVGAREIVKVSYERSEPTPQPKFPWQWLGWQPAQDAVALPMAAYGASFHLELQAPEEMAFVRGDLFVASGDSVVLKARTDEGGRRIHLQAGGLDRSTTAAIVRLRAQSTLLTGAAAASLFNLIVLLFVRLRVEEFSSTSNGEAAVAVMLAVPGLLVGYIARPSEHEVLSRFLVGVRVVALTSASLSFIAALTLFAGYDLEELRCILAAVVVSAAICAVLLTTSWLRQRG